MQEKGLETHVLILALPTQAIQPWSSLSCSVLIQQSTCRANVQQDGLYIVINYPYHAESSVLKMAPLQMETVHP